MARKKQKKETLPDLIYDNILVTKLINQVMKRGKKNAARKIVYGAFEIIKEKEKKEPLEVFEEAIKNIKPLVEVRPKRVGGATYQVPRPVPEERAFALSVRWLLETSRGKKGKPMREKLAEEIILSFKKQGAAMKKKENMHRMAEANRAFAHFAW